MSEQQRQAWREALATQGRLSRGGRGIRYRQRRTGLGGLDGPGRVRVRVALPVVVDGQGDDEHGDDSGRRGDDDISTSS